MSQWRSRLLLLVCLGFIVLFAVLVFDDYVIGSNPEYSGKVMASNDKSAMKAGNSLFSIAGKYGTTVDTVKKANRLKPDSTYAGQVLTIPHKDREPPVSRQSAPSKPATQQPGPSKPAPVTLGEILRANGLTGAELTITVDKSDHVLSIYSGSQRLKSYHVELGDSGLADKAVSGDHKTPEGIFYIAEKSVLNPPDQFLGTRWMRLSYPNIEDADRGLSRGIIDQYTHDVIVAANNNREIPPQTTALGGGVGIHGGDDPSLGKDWTWGCVGLKNKDVEDFYDYVRVGTTVVIRN